MNCIFSEPLVSKKTGEITTLVPPDATNQNFQYSKMVCDTTELTQTQTLIENAETGAKFWVNGSFTYGEATIIIFLTIFTLCIIGKIIYNFLFKNA
jgi:hypothetical protein